MEMTNILIGFFTLLLTFGSFYLAIRSEIKNNNQKLSDWILSNEKRHSGHEKQLALLYEKFQNLEIILNSKLNDLHKLTRK